METRRIILAIVLSLGVLLLWQYVFVKKAPETAPPPQPVAAQAAAPAPETETAGRPEAETAPAEERASDAAEALNAETEEEIIVSTSLYTARWTNKGGVLLSWKLHHHKNEKDEALELVPAAAEASGVQPLALLEALDPSRATIEELRSTPLNTALYEATGGNLSLKDGEKGVLRFRYADGRGLEAEKTFTFTGGRYDVGAAVTVRRGGRPADVRIVWGPGCGNPSEAELKQRFGAGAGASFLAGTKVYRVEEKKYKPESSVFNFLTWSAYDDNYFATIFLPETASGSASFLRFENGKTPLLFLAASAPRTIFIGPKEMGVLTALGSETKRVVRYGMFGFITEILFVSLRAIHKVVPNWGFAIIVLTILIKILFFPLTYSSSKSMARMADLQPKIKALRAKYKKAKTDIEQRRQMNEEMMKLYKEHGVNPAGGCLPMLIQLPIFWGFFRMLTVAIELRHSPWILWIKDLSVHDPTYVTPILMGVTQFISQKMTPTSADPAQARMMLIMPVVMTLFFLNFQSGLVLYWLTSNVLQIGQQALMNRMMQKKKVVSHGKSRKNDAVTAVEEIPEFKGKNLEDAILHAEHKLKVPRTEFEYEVVTEKTRLFGLGKEVVIRARVKRFAKNGDLTVFLDRLMNVFPLDLTYEIKTKEDISFVIFGGADRQILLWKDGALLLAIQHLLNKISDRKVQVDCEFFRKRKEKSLRDYALDVARRVADSGRNEILDLMNPYERRIVHIAANQVPGITSESLGEGFLKRVKIYPLSKRAR